MRKSVLSLAVVALLVPAASAQINSPDGMWAGTIDPNNTGQLTGVAFLGNDDLFETLFYEASDPGGLTQRVESNYGPISQIIGANSASFVSMRNDGLVRLDTFVTMLDGASGGALITTTYTNVDPNGRTIRLKPFMYADIDAEPGAGGDSTQWLGNAVEQSDSLALWWFGGAGPYKSWQIDTFAGLRTALDGGVSQLTSAGGGGPADWTAALAGDLVSLSEGDSVSLRVGIGGEGIPEPASLTLLALGALALIRRR